MTAHRIGELSGILAPLAFPWGSGKGESQPRYGSQHCHWATDIHAFCAIPHQAFFRIRIWPSAPDKAKVEGPKIFTGALHTHPKCISRIGKSPRLAFPSNSLCRQFILSLTVVTVAHTPTGGSEEQYQEAALAKPAIAGA